MPELILRSSTFEASAYHADPAPEPSLSASVAHILYTKSPLHAWAAHPKLGATKRETTKSMDEGTLIHSLLLEPDGGEEIWIIEHDSYRTKAAKLARDEAIANDAIPVLIAEHDRAWGAADKIRARLLEEHGIDLTAGETEVSIVWRDELRESHGGAGDVAELCCRSRLDAIQGRVIYDLKKTRSAAPEDAAKAVANYGYAIQAAAYTRALEVAEPELEGVVDFVFVFVETFPPYAAVPYRLDGIYREYGERLWDRACRTWAECLREKRWPGYQIQHLTPPGWILSKLALY